jgi:CDP-diacylglycerol--serine O-phosphatidyltransferase
VGLDSAYLLCLLWSEPVGPVQITAEALATGGDKVPYYEGTPIPTNVILIAVLAVAAWQGRLDEKLYWGTWTLGPWELHPLVLLFALSGTMMISKTVRFPKL